MDPPPWSERPGTGPRARDFTSQPAVGGWAGIFQIGCGWLDPLEGRWRFAQLTAERLDDRSEGAVIGAWLAHLGGLCRDAGVGLNAARVVHWSAAESSSLDTAYNAACARHVDAGWPDVPWFDLLALARGAPLGVTGAFGYGLKAIAKAMAAMGHIVTTWGDGPTDGLGAMVGAWWCDPEARRLGVPMIELPLMRHIGAYNEVDCRAMAESLRVAASESLTVAGDRVPTSPHSPFSRCVNGALRGCSWRHRRGWS